MSSSDSPDDSLDEKSKSSSKKRSPKTSPKNSSKKSPKTSPKNSSKTSPKTSPKNSSKTSPKGSPKDAKEQQPGFPSASSPLQPGAPQHATYFPPESPIAGSPGQRFQPTPTKEDSSGSGSEQFKDSIEDGTDDSEMRAMENLQMEESGNVSGFTVSATRAAKELIAQLIDSADSISSEHKKLVLKWQEALLTALEPHEEILNELLTRSLYQDNELANVQQQVNMKQETIDELTQHLRELENEAQQQQGVQRTSGIEEDSLGGSYGSESDEVKEDSPQSPTGAGMQEDDQAQEVGNMFEFLDEYGSPGGRQEDDQAQGVENMFEFLDEYGSQSSEYADSLGSGGSGSSSISQTSYQLQAPGGPSQEPLVLSVSVDRDPRVSPAQQDTPWMSSSYRVGLDFRTPTKPGKVYHFNKAPPVRRPGQTGDEWVPGAQTPKGIFQKGHYGVRNLFGPVQRDGKIYHYNEAPPVRQHDPREAWQQGQQTPKGVFMKRHYGRRKLYDD